MALTKRMKTAAIAAGVLAVVTGATQLGTVSGASAAGTAAAPSGQAMPVGDVGRFTQIFKDDFTRNVALGSFGKANATSWGAYDDGWKDTSKNGTYSPSKVLSVKGGVLDMNIHTENGVHMVSAPVAKINGAGRPEGQLYGRYVARFRSDNLPGYKIAWLLWPDTDNWDDGEIDFPEANLDGRIEGFMHHKGAPREQDAYSTEVSTRGWHTAVLEWTPEYVRFELDGKQVGKSTDRKLIPSKPMHWVLQTETALSGPAPAAKVAGHVQVDWVSVYKYQR